MVDTNQDPALPEIGARLALTRRHRHADVGHLRSGLQRIPVDQELSLSDWDRVTDLGVLQIG